MVPVRLTVEKSQRLNVVAGRGSEVNDGGLAIRAESELAIGDEAEMRFTPPHFYPFVTLRGVVRNRAGNVYGVEFLASSPAQSRQLAIFRHILLRWRQQ
jgi:hypothetical protein